MLDRYRGCLFGGAVGDAMGYPVEFMKEDAIWAKYGPKSIQTLKQVGSPALIWCAIIPAGKQDYSVVVSPWEYKESVVELIPAAPVKISPRYCNNTKKGNG